MIIDTPKCYWYPFCMTCYYSFKLFIKTLQQWIKFYTTNFWSSCGNEILIFWASWFFKKHFIIRIFFAIYLCYSKNCKYFKLNTIWFPFIIIRYVWEWNKMKFCLQEKSGYSKKIIYIHSVPIARNHSVPISTFYQAASNFQFSFVLTTQQ